MFAYSDAFFAELALVLGLDQAIYVKSFGSVDVGLQIPDMNGAILAPAGQNGFNRTPPDSIRRLRIMTYEIQVGLVLLLPHL